ncbi:type II secretion system protein GspL [Geotalea toluenoxydans]|uniref:type II secretion system protein GspL n=1 Tax=Geotalea toluenoxydans TaxID=421624 RepID=UPI000ACA835C|nr:type II secretion system protein GspL [Geotalea toluenoxydans]
MNLLIIQLKRNELVFANFRSKRGELSFIEAARHPLSQEDSLPVLLQEFAAKKAEERRVILAIPSNHLFMREMELPIADRRKVRELLPLELKGETAVDTDQLVFDALPLTEGKVLAVWAKHHWLQETIALLVEKGLEPEIVTASLFNWQSLIPQKPAPARSPLPTASRWLSTRIKSRSFSGYWQGAKVRRQEPGCRGNRQRDCR